MQDDAERNSGQARDVEEKEIIGASCEASPESEPERQRTAEGGYTTRIVGTLLKDIPNTAQSEFRQGKAEQKMNEDFAELRSLLSDLDAETAAEKLEERWPTMKPTQEQQCREVMREARSGHIERQNEGEAKEQSRTEGKAESLWEKAVPVSAEDLSDDKDDSMSLSLSGMEEDSFSPTEEREEKQTEETTVEGQPSKKETEKKPKLLDSVLKLFRKDSETGTETEEPAELPTEEPTRESVREPEQKTAEEKKQDLISKFRFGFLFKGQGDNETAVKEQPEPEAEKEPSEPEAGSGGLSLPSQESVLSPSMSEDSEEKPTAEGNGEEEQPKEPKKETPEAVGEKLKHLKRSALLRCIFGGILAAALLVLSTVNDGGTLGGNAFISPLSNATAFMAVNLLLLIAACGVSAPNLRKGWKGIRGEATVYSVPSVAAAAALIESFVAVTRANLYSGSGLTLMSGVAALLLFLCSLGDWLQVTAAGANYQVILNSREQSGAYHLKEIHLVQLLTRRTDREEKQPCVLLSRPVKWTTGFMERSFDTKISDTAGRYLTYFLLASGAMAFVLTLLSHHGLLSALSAATTAICLGAPFSTTLLIGFTKHKLQQDACGAGAVVPGWAAAEELGRSNVLHVDAAELFPPECVHLEDMRVFKGSEIDRVLMDAASLMSKGCNTLRAPFMEIVDSKTGMLVGVEQSELQYGLGISALCDGKRVIMGTRAMMEQAGVVLPDEEYETERSRNGSLQVLYMATEGSLSAMFLVKYLGSRRVAQSLSILNRENIGMLVSCEDPSLTKERIEKIYHLKEGMVEVLDAEKVEAMRPAVAFAEEEDCCMIYQNNFNSMTGGIHAAEKAIKAARLGLILQWASVLVAMILGSLIAYSGSLGTTKTLLVLIYQIFWSVLTLLLATARQNIKQGSTSAPVRKEGNL